MNAIDAETRGHGEDFELNRPTGDEMSDSDHHRRENRQRRDGWPGRPGEKEDPDGGDALQEHDHRQSLRFFRFLFRLQNRRRVGDLLRRLPGIGCGCRSHALILQRRPIRLSNLFLPLLDGHISIFACIRCDNAIHLVPKLVAQTWPKSGISKGRMLTTIHFELGADGIAFRFA